MSVCRVVQHLSDNLASGTRILAPLALHERQHGILVSEEEVYGPSRRARLRIRDIHFALDKKPPARIIWANLLAGEQLRIALEKILKLLLLVFANDR